jgi:hypothetical protein
MVSQWRRAFDEGRAMVREAAERGRENPEPVELAPSAVDDDEKAGLRALLAEIAAAAEASEAMVEAPLLCKCRVRARCC